MIRLFILPSIHSFRKSIHTSPYLFISLHLCTLPILSGQLSPNHSRSFSVVRLVGMLSIGPSRVFASIAAKLAHWCCLHQQLSHSPSTTPSLHHNLFSLITLKCAYPLQLLFSLSTLWGESDVCPHHWWWIHYFLLKKLSWLESSHRIIWGCFDRLSVQLHELQLICEMRGSLDELRECLKYHRSVLYDFRNPI